MMSNTVDKLEKNSQVQLYIAIEKSIKLVRLTNKLHNSIEKFVKTHPDDFGNCLVNVTDLSIF